MARRRRRSPRVGGKKANACQKLDCRYLAHGYYSMIPAVLSSMAFWTMIVQDGCDYAKLRGGNVETISGSDVLPFLEVGISQYRAPMYYSSENDWKMVFTEHCKDYPENDSLRTTARWLLFVSWILGGSVTLFLWFTACFSFSARTWRFCGLEALLAAFFRGGSFLFLIGSTCNGENNTRCIISFGGQMDIVGIVLWVVTALILFGHYPEPKLRALTEAELIEQEQREEEEDNILAPKRLLVVNRQSFAGGESNRYGRHPSGNQQPPQQPPPPYSSVHVPRNFNDDDNNNDHQSIASRSYYSRPYDNGRSMASQSYYAGQDGRNMEGSFV